MDLVDRVDLMDLMDRVDNKKKGFFTPQGTDFQSVSRVEICGLSETNPPLPPGSPPVLLLLPYVQLFNPITP